MAAINDDPEPELELLTLPELLADSDGTACEPVASATVRLPDDTDGDACGDVCSELSGDALPPPLRLIRSRSFDLLPRGELSDAKAEPACRIEANARWLRRLSLFRFVVLPDALLLDVLPEPTSPVLVGLERVWATERDR